MLNSFRSLSGGIGAKIFLGFLVLTFMVWGIEDMIRPASRVAVAMVGSEKISNIEFQRALNRESDGMRRILGDNFSPEMLKQLRLPQQVLKRLINQSLIRQESKELGVIPSDANVVRRIRSTPAFQDSKGNFDKSLFETALRNAGMSEKAYVDQLRDDMAADLLVGSLVTAMPVSDTAVRTLVAARQEQRALTLYRLRSSLVGGVPAPKDDEIKAYYQSHSREFTAPEYRSISYVTITSENVPPAQGVSEETLRAAYQERIEEFRKPERRSIEQLLYSNEEKAHAAEALLKAGKTFSQVAKETDILNANALSLGSVERSGIIEQAADKVFTLKSGAVTAPIQSPFGWHIFRVASIIPPATQPFEEVRPLLEKDAKARGADDALNQVANRLEDTLAGGAPLQEAAREQGMKVYSFGPVKRV